MAVNPAVEPRRKRGIPHTLRFRKELPADRLMHSAGPETPSPSSAKLRIAHTTRLAREGSLKGCEGRALSEDEMVRHLIVVAVLETIRLIKDLRH